MIEINSIPMHEEPIIKKQNKITLPNIHINTNLKSAIIIPRYKVEYTF